MEEELVIYFGSIVKQDRVDRYEDITKITRHIPSLLTPRKNEILNRPVEMRQVEEDVHRMAEGKAPGPNGFTMNLFHQFWDIIK